MCIATVCFPGFNAINFEIELTFLIKPFFYMTKKSRQKFKYLQSKKCEIKRIIFERLSVARNCLRPESVPLKSFV